MKRNRTLPGALPRPDRHCRGRWGHPHGLATACIGLALSAVLGLAGPPAHAQDAPEWLQDLPRPISRANAASWYWRGLEASAAIDPASRQAIADWDRRGPAPPRIVVALDRARPMLDLIAAGTDRRRCDWAFDLSAGPELLLPHLSQLRFAGQCFAARGAKALAEGDAEGVIRAVNRMDRLSGHLTDDGFLISSLVGMSVNRMSGALADRAVRAGLIDAAGAIRLAETSRPYTVPGGFGLPDALRSEGDMLTGWIEGELATGPEGLDAVMEIVTMFGDESDAGERLRARDADALIEDAAGMRDVLNEAAELAAADPSDAVTAEIAALGAAVEAGEAGDFSVLLMASFDRAIDARNRSMAEVADRVERLESIARDASGVDLDAAAYYRRALAAWAGMDAAARDAALDEATGAAAGAATDDAGPTDAVDGAVDDAWLAALSAGAGTAAFDAELLRTSADSLVVPAWTGGMAEMLTAVRIRVQRADAALAAGGGDAVADGRSSLAAERHRLVTIAIGVAGHLAASDVPGASTLAWVHLSELAAMLPETGRSFPPVTESGALAARAEAIERLRGRRGLGFVPSVERLSVSAAQAVMDARDAVAGRTAADRGFTVETASGALPAGPDERMALLMVLERTFGRAGSPLVAPRTLDGGADPAVTQPTLAPGAAPGFERFLDIVALARLRRGAATVREYVGGEVLDITAWSDPSVRPLRLDEGSRAAGDVVRQILQRAAVDAGVERDADGPDGPAGDRPESGAERGPAGRRGSDSADVTAGAD